MLMTAAVVRETGRFEIEDVDLDEPRPDEVLVRIAAVGICHTDLAVRDRHIPLPLPAILGHEGAGIVVRVGSCVTAVEPGDHVIVSYGSCGGCTPCREERPFQCDRFVSCNVGGGRLDGSPTVSQQGKPLTAAFFAQSSFATHALTLERNVVKVAADLPFHILAPLGCSIQTGAGAVFNALRAQAGQSIAVFGAGAVGLSAVMAAAAVDCRPIIAIDVHPARLDLARSLGATHAIDARHEDPIAAIRSITGSGAVHAVEATGVPDVMAQAFEALARAGTLVVLGVAPPGATMEIDAAGVLNGKTVRGAIEGESVPASFLPQLIELYRSGRFPIDRLVTCYPFDQINRAAEAGQSGEVVKPVLILPESLADHPVPSSNT